MGEVEFRAKTPLAPVPPALPAGKQLDLPKARRLAFLDAMEVATTSTIAGGALLAAPYLLLPSLAPLLSGDTSSHALVTGAIAAVGTGAALIYGLAMHRTSRASAAEKAALAGPNGSELYADLDTVRATTFAAPLSILITLALPAVGLALVALEAWLGSAAGSRATRALTDAYTS